ncbi:hypothetical protein V6N13_121463 [Hibiscus sabdariffa]|uniref:BHLH domain-containing protein n=1 Tax=Hibiscus sabdariffa TaxID=183260 RepID=A0ABR2PDQ0_9ROSI
MFNGHSSSRNWSMGGYSSDGSTSWMRDKSQFPLETDQLSIDGSFKDDSGIGWFDSENNVTNDINGGQMESLNYQFNVAETSTEAGCAKSKLTPSQREKKRISDVNYRQKLEEKMRVLQGLVPGCSKVKGKEAMLDEIINYVRSFQQAIEVVEEKAAGRIAEHKHLNEEIERLNAEITMLQEQIGLLPSIGKQLENQSVSLQLATDHHVSISEAVDKDHHGTNSEAVDRLSSLETNELQNMQGTVPVNATSLVSGGGVTLPTVNLLQLETVSASKFSSFTSVGLMQGPQDIVEVNGVKLVSGVEAQLNATEAPGDACLQDQEISLKKRKRSGQDADVDQAKGGQPLNLETKDSVENQEQGALNLTTTTKKSTGKQGRQGSQASDPPEEENVCISAQVVHTTSSHCVAEKVRREMVKQQMKFLLGLVPGCSKVTGLTSMLDEVINHVQSLQRQVKFLSRKLAASRPLSNSDEAITDILSKLEADDESKVKLSDFDGLDGARITIGKYSFPISLHPIIKKIFDVYGDVSATSKMNPTIAEAIYIMFCASVKEMSDQRLEQVTEGLILKWRDVIRDALSMNFKVDFAMKHLTKIARGYIGLTEHSKILRLEAQLSARKERSKVFMDAAEDFCGKPVSSGMFPDAQTTRVRLGKNDSASSFSSY